MGVADTEACSSLCGVASSEGIAEFICNSCRISRCCEHSVHLVVRLCLFHKHSQSSVERVICVQQLASFKETLQQALRTYTHR